MQLSSTCPLPLIFLWLPWLPELEYAKFIFVSEYFASFSLTLVGSCFSRLVGKFVLFALEQTHDIMHYLSTRIIQCLKPSEEKQNIDEDYVRPF